MTPRPFPTRAAAPLFALVLVVSPVAAVTAGTTASPGGTAAATAPMAAGDTDAPTADGGTATAEVSAPPGRVLPRDPGTPGGPADVDVIFESCYKPGADQKEIYGPTNVNAQLGNQELSVAVTRNGTVSVFKWPRPSYHDQVKYHATNRSERFMGADRNAGAFLGLVATTGTSRAGETGTVEVAADGGDWRTVPLEGSYDDPVVVASPASAEGSQPAHPRVRNVTDDSFELQVEEWNYQDGSHVTETVHYLVMESGTYELAGGTEVAVGSVGTDESWKRVRFDREFADAPVVLAQSQTHSNGNWVGGGSEAIVTRTRAVNGTGVDVRVQEQESFGDHATEQVGYVAVAPGQGNASDAGAFEAGRVDPGVGSDRTRLPFDRSFDDAPLPFAATQSFDGPDPAALRYDDLDAGGVDLFVEEGTSADGETYHADETVGYLAVAGEGTVHARDRQVTWLRNWEASQRYAANYSDTVVTEYVHDDLGLTVTVTDAVATDRNVLTRQVEVDRQAGSPVRDAEAVAFENFNLVASKLPMSPTKEWCREGQNDDAARYEAGGDAVFHYLRNGTAGNDVVTAMGFDGGSDGHQVGGDVEESNASVGVSVPFAGTVAVEWGAGTHGDAYVDVTQDAVLAGHDRFSGQTTGALTRDLEFSDGSATAAVHLAAAESRNGTRELLSAARAEPFAQVREEKREWLEARVADAPLPATDDPNVTALSRRALVTLVQNYDPKSGAMVASIATQSPYGADWIRDGAYFNYALDRLLDEHGWVNQRNRWYASLQEGANQHVNSPAIPDGNWAMNYYADGTVAGPIPWEIDETGYGLWTLYDHYRVTGNGTYLEQVYPAIERGAEHLLDCKDAAGRQCEAHEDDNLEPAKTIVGGASVDAGLQAAVLAAEALGKQDDADRFRERLHELGAAIDEHYYDETAGSYASPRVVMPAFLKPLDSPRMQRHLQSMWASVEPTFDGERRVGLYESKSLLGLAKGWEGNETRMARVEEGLDWVADEHATPDTHVMGEVWLRHPNTSDGEVVTSVSQPHAWEQLLFYLAALETYPPSEAVEETLATGERRWRRHDPTVVAVDQQDSTVSPGDAVKGTVTVRNDGTADGTFGVSYEVVGPDGTTWRGRGANVTLAPNGTGTVAVGWQVPAGAPAGEYDVRVRAWKEPTPRYRHTVLAAVNRTAAFTVG